MWTGYKRHTGLVSSPSGRRAGRLRIARTHHAARLVIDSRRRHPLKCAPLALPPHAHRTARTVRGKQRNPQNRRLAQIDSRTGGNIAIGRLLVRKREHSLTASLTGFSLRSGDKPLARAAYFKTNPNAEPLDSVNEKKIDSGTFYLINVREYL